MIDEFQPEVVTRVGQLIDCALCKQPFVVRRKGNRHCSQTCARRRPKASQADRFWAKVNKTATCWLWTGALRGNGYGILRIGPATASMMYAHRYSYELLVGPIPDGLQIDHLCRVRGCVNPAHLEPVTSRENNLRSESPSAKQWRAGVCGRGHPKTPENAYIRPDTGSRDCLACRRENKQRARTARR